MIAPHNAYHAFFKALGAVPVAGIRTRAGGVLK